MNDKRREILIGYLLGVLEPQESAKVDAELQTNSVVRDDLAAIYREISPINEIVDDHEPPTGLATRTCRNLWARIDSTQNSPDVNVTVPRASHKKRRITVVVSQDERLYEAALSRCELETQDLNTDAIIPLSQALQVASSAKPRKSNEILRRVDPAENAPRETHLFLADSMMIAKNHPPKYYGSEKKTEKVKTSWTTRDVFASLLVGLTAAVLIFPLIQFGMGNFREMIIQKKLENVAKSVAPNTSQYSPYGMSQNDLRALAGMNIAPQSTGALPRQQNDAFPPFLGFQEHDFSPSPATPMIPVGLSGVPPTRQFDSTGSHFPSD
ncbi:MAG: hypothetical protein FWH27_11505 [Planctomycetaceae bacterium]|nr:hypothetical protein [Planctomycetaceae bacterium]